MHRGAPACVRARVLLYLCRRKINTTALPSGIKLKKELSPPRNQSQPFLLGAVRYSSARLVRRPCVARSLCPFGRSGRLGMLVGWPIYSGEPTSKIPCSNTLHLEPACCRFRRCLVHASFIHFWMSGVGSCGRVLRVVEVLLMRLHHGHAAHQHRRPVLHCLLHGLHCHSRFIARLTALFEYDAV